MRNVLTVFIGSPSDLGPERERAFQVVAEINQILRPTNWSIELLGWEDTLPGYGRPQALINRDVELCDLFIGTVWRRWGTPPAQDSAFASGFEEEFMIARTRREQDNSPEIWMFFKHVDAAQVADAGAQLQRVIAFRESLIEGKTVLFKQFDTTDAWEKMLRTYLLRHVLELARTPSNAPERPSTVVVSTRADSATSSTPAAGDQLATLARALEPAFATGNLEEVGRSLNDGHTEAFLAVRTLLLSVALVAASGTSASPMPTHELNTLYRYRNRLQTTEDELTVLFRTILEDASDTKPGWFWLKALEMPDVLARLWRTILYEDGAQLRSASLDILRKAKVPLFEGLRDAFVHETLPTLTGQALDSAWSYLVDVSTQEDVEMLGEASGTWLEPRLGWLRRWVESGRELDRFLPQKLDAQFLPDSMERSILERIRTVSTASLEMLHTVPSPALSEAAFAEMQRRGLAGPDAVKPSKPRGPMLASLGSLGSYESVFGFGASSEHGSAPSESDDDIYARHNRQSSDGLKKTLDWLNVDGSTVYRLLVERGEIPRETVRDDILSGFTRLREVSNASIDTAYGSDAAAVKRDFDKYHSFITRQFTKGALVALVEGATAEDVPIARRLLKQGGTRSESLRILASCGDSTDVDDLLEVALASYGDDRIVALEGVCRWTTDKLGTANALLAAEGRELRRAGLTLLKDAQEEEAVPILQELLSHDDEEVRVTAIALLRLRMDGKEMSELLGWYTNRTTYYYNVVSWVDRILYAPKPINDYYVNSLESKLKEALSWNRSR